MFFWGNIGKGWRHAEASEISELISELKWPSLVEHLSLFENFQLPLHKDWLLSPMTLIKSRLGSLEGKWRQGNLPRHDEDMLWEIIDFGKVEARKAHDDHLLLQYAIKHDR